MLFYERTLVGIEFSWHWLKSFFIEVYVNVTLKGAEELIKKVAKTDIAGNCAAKNVIYFPITFYVFFYNSVSPSLYLVDSDNYSETEKTHYKGHLRLWKGYMTSSKETVSVEEDTRNRLYSKLLATAWVILNLKKKQHLK